MNNIFVYIELEDGAIADVSLELLTKGRELADSLGVKLEAVAMGVGLTGIEKELAKYGADTVWVADDEVFAPFRTLPHTSVLCGLIEAEQPQIVLFGATPVGRDFAPRVSSATTRMPRRAPNTRTCSIRSVPLSAATSSRRSSTPTIVRRWLPSARA